MKFKLVLLILNNRVAVQYIEKCSSFSDFQHGFWFSYSNVDLLAVVSARIVGAFHWYGDTQTATLVIFKVFDKV